MSPELVANLAVGVALAGLFLTLLTRIDRRIDRIDQRMDRLEQRIDRLEQRIDALEQRFERRIDDLAERLARLEALIGVRLDLWRPPEDPAGQAEAAGS